MRNAIIVVAIYLYFIGWIYINSYYYYFGIHLHSLDIPFYYFFIYAGYAAGEMIATIPDFSLVIFLFVIFVITVGTKVINKPPIKTKNRGKLLTILEKIMKVLPIVIFGLFIYQITFAWQIFIILILLYIGLIHCIIWYKEINERWRMQIGAVLVAVMCFVFFYDMAKNCGILRAEKRVESSDTPVVRFVLDSTAMVKLPSDFMDANNMGKLRLITQTRDRVFVYQKFVNSQEELNIRTYDVVKSNMYMVDIIEQNKVGKVGFEK